MKDEKQCQQNEEKVRQNINKCLTEREMCSKIKINVQQKERKKKEVKSVKVKGQMRQKEQKNRNVGH